MRKKVVSVILVGALVASLGAMAGCDSSSGDNEEKAEEEAEKDEEKAEKEEEKEEKAEEKGDDKKAEKDEEKAEKDEEKAEKEEEKAEKEETKSGEYDLSELGDETYSLIVTSHDPEESATGTFLNNWADSIEEASDGHLDIEVYHGAILADSTDTLDAVKDGTADIGWGVQSFYADMFPVTEVFMLPMLEIESATQGSEAIWDFYNNTDYMEDEYSDYHVLLLHTNCQSPISLLNKEVEDITEFNGMEIRGNAGPPTSFIQDLGATPVSIDINNLYALSSSTLDGIITDWHAISSFKLDDAIEYYMDENVGVSTYFLLMNKDSYEKLPDVLQKIIDDKSSEAIQYTDAWDDVASDIKAQVEDEGKLYTLSDDERGKLESVAQSTISQWIVKTNSLGLDGQAIYDAALESIEKAN